MTQEIYALSRGNVEAERLDRQHIALKDFDAGDILHKSIPTQRFKGKKALAVADIATGTGVWLLDFANQIDNDGGAGPEFIGFDITTSLLSSEAQHKHTQKHIEFVVHDMFEPFPEKYHARFDLVHVRLVICAVPKSAISKLLRNLREIMKPGGYLAWHEAEYTDFIAQPPHPTALATYQRIEQIVNTYAGSTALPSAILATIVNESRPVDSSLAAKKGLSVSDINSPSLVASSTESSKEEEQHLRLVAFERSSSATFEQSSRHTNHVNLCQVWSNAIRKAGEKRQKELDELESETGQRQVQTRHINTDTAEKTQERGRIQQRLDELKRGILADQKLADDLERAASDGSFEWHLAFTWIVAQKYPLVSD